MAWFWPEARRKEPRLEVAQALWRGLQQPGVTSDDEIDRYLADLDRYIQYQSKATLPRELRQQVRRHLTSDPAIFRSFYDRLSTPSKGDFVAHCARKLGFFGRPATSSWTDYVETLSTRPATPTGDHLRLMALRREAPADFLAYLYPEALQTDATLLPGGEGSRQAATRVARALRAQGIPPWHTIGWHYRPECSELRLFDLTELSRAVEAHPYRPRAAGESWYAHQANLRLVQNCMRCILPVATWSLTYAQDADMHTSHVACGPREEGGRLSELAVTSRTFVAQGRAWLLHGVEETNGEP